LSISNISVSESDVGIGNPYNTYFTVRVKSGDFERVSNFEYDIKDFLDFIRSLKDLYDFKVDCVELNDIGYGSKIEFSMGKTGLLGVSGIIYGGAREHSLEFNFGTDQTALEHFSRRLYNDFIGNM